jgi:spore germination protein KB
MSSDRSTINLRQLASLLCCYVIGSAIVFIPNPLTAAAGNDAWISMTLAYGFGIIMLTCVLYLHNRHDGASVIAYSRKLIGRTATYPVGLLYILMLFFAACAVNASIGDFFTSVMMKRTPSYIFHTIGMLLSALTARSGIRVMARMFFLLLWLMLFFSLLVMILAIPIYQPAMLLPLFENGIKPMLHGLFISAGFPFGEIVIFAMLLPFVRLQAGQSISKALYASYSFSALMLIVPTICTIMAFGPAAGYFNYSLYRLSIEIHIVELFQRMEAIIGIALILGSYMKATLLLFIIYQCLIQLFNLKDDHVLMYPLSVTCIFLSATMFQSPADFQEQVYTIWPFTVIVVGGGLILLFTLITWIKHRRYHQAERGDIS